jgi:hypothetical protein
MEQFLPILTYAGFASLLFVGAMLWNKYRRHIKRKLHVTGYVEHPVHEHHSR